MLSAPVQLPRECSVASLPGHKAVMSAPVHLGLASSQRSASNELKHLFHYNQCNKRKSSTRHVVHILLRKKIEDMEPYFCLLE